jgi:segregation and condensation protein A
MVEKKEGYKVKLSNFEGPLDLLLFLIKKEEIDIYDIPIASITKQYLEYIELMRELDLEVAGEFILMAATLIRIKVRMLLPRTPEEEEEAEEDPRAELVRQLIEYKRFKEVAETFSEFEEKQRRMFPRVYFDWTKKYSKQESVDDEFLKDVTMFDLLSAFKTVIENMPKVTTHEVGTISVTIDDQIDFIMKRIEEKERVGFTEVMNMLKTRVIIIVTFMAILELLRTHRIRIQQASVFSEIWISRR